MALNASLSLLSQDYVEFDEASVENGIDADEALENAVVALESQSARLDAIDSVLEQLESGELKEEDVTLESLGAAGRFYRDCLRMEGHTGLTLESRVDADFYDHLRSAMLRGIERLQSNEALSMEDRESLSLLEMTLEAEVGGVSNIFERLWQSEFMLWLKRFDWVADLVKNDNGNLKKYRERLKKTQEKLDKKKPKLTQQTHIGSYVKMENYWVTDKGFVKDIFGTLKKDLKMTEYCCKEYPKLIEGEMDKFAQVLRSARPESSVSMESTAMRGLLKLKHPAYLFDNSYLGGRPYLMFTGLRLAKKKKVEGDEYAKITHPNKVKISTRIYLATGRALTGDIYHDVKMSTREIEELIGWGHKFLDVAEGVLRNVTSMENRVSTLRAAMEVLVKRSKETNDKAMAKQIKILGRHAKNLVDCYWSPSMKCASRNIKVAKGIDYLADRMTAVAK